jgi:integrase
VDPLGKLAGNPCEGIKQLYSGDRSEVIWTDADIAQLKAAKGCSAEIAHAVDLAAHTGLRLGDLLRLCWSHVGDDAIVIATGKSNQRREAIIPLYGHLSLPNRMIEARTSIVPTTKAALTFEARQIHITVRKPNSFSRALCAASRPAPYSCRVLDTPRSAALAFSGS